MKKGTLLSAAAVALAIGLAIRSSHDQALGKERAAQQRREASSEAPQSQPPAGSDVTLVSRSAEPGEISANSGERILLEVVDRQGVMVSGAHAFWQAEGMANYLGTSDESGWVAGQMIALGGQGAIIAWHQTRGAGTLEVLAGQTTRAPLRVTIDPFATVTGRVELPEGIEVGDLDLILHVDAVDAPLISDLEPTSDAARSRADASRPEVGLHAIYHQREQVRPEMGQYQIHGLMPGLTYRLRLTGRAVEGEPRERLLPVPSSGADFKLRFLLGGGVVLVAKTDGSKINLGPGFRDALGIIVPDDADLGLGVVNAYGPDLEPCLDGVPGWQGLLSGCNQALVLTAPTPVIPEGLVKATIDLERNGRRTVPIKVQWLGLGAEATEVELDTALLYDQDAGAVEFRFVSASAEDPSTLRSAGPAGGQNSLGRLSLSSEYGGRELIVTNSHIDGVRMEGLALGEWAFSFEGSIPGIRYPAGPGQYRLFNVTQEDQIVEIALPSARGQVSFELLGSQVKNYRDGLVVVYVPAGSLTLGPNGQYRIVDPKYLHFTGHPYGPASLLPGNYECMVWSGASGPDTSTLTPFVVEAGNQTTCVLSLGDAGLKPH